MSFTTSPSRPTFDSFNSTVNTSYQAETMKRTNESMRERIAQLKRELQEERNRAKQAHLDKVAGINRAQVQAQEMLRHRITEEHEQLEAEKTREVASVTTRMLTQQERDLRERARQQAQDDAERAALEARERRAAEEALRARVREETAEEYEEDLGRQLYNATQDLADVTEQRDQLQRLYSALAEADADKALQIRDFEKNKTAEINKILKQGRADFAQELRELKSKDAKITALEKENANLRRKNGMLQSEKGEMSERLQRINRAEKWDRSTPKKKRPGIGLYDPAMSGGSLTATPVRTRTVTRTVRTPQSVNQSRDLRNLEKTVATLRSQNESLKREGQAYERSMQPKLAKLSSRNSELSAKLRRSEAKAKDTASQMQDLDARRQALEKELQNTKKQLGLARQAKASRTGSPSKSSDAKNLKAQLEQSTSQAKELTAKNVEVSKRLRDRELQIDTLKKNLKKLESEKREMNKQLSLARDSTPKATQQVAELKSQLSSMKRKLDSAPAPTASKEYKALQTKYNDLLKQSKAKKTTVSPEVTELQGKLRQAEGQLTSARRGIDAEKKKVAEQIGEVKKLKKTVADFKETQKALELDLSRTKKELAERTNEVAKRSTASPAKTDTKALDSLKRSNAGLKGEVSTLEQERSKLELKIERYAHELEESREQLDKAKKAAREKSGQQAQVAQKANAELEDALADQRRQTETLERKLQDSAAMHAQQADAANRELLDVQATLDQQVELNEKLQQQLADFESKLQNHEAEGIREAAEKARQEREAMQAALEEAEALRQKEAAERQAAQEALARETAAREAEEQARRDAEAAAEKAERTRQLEAAEAERARQVREEEEREAEEARRRDAETAEREEAERAQAEAERLAREEQQRQEAEQRAAEEAELARQAEEQRKRDEEEAERQRQAEQEAEAARIAAAEAEEEKQAAERLRLEQEAEEKRLAEEQRRAEEQRQAEQEEEERLRLEAEREEAERQAREEKQRRLREKEEQLAQLEQEQLEADRKQQAAGSLAATQAGASDSKPNTEELPFMEEEPGRLFRVLYDYDPEENSPNDDEGEELPLLEGQIIQIFGDVDEDGFFEGQNEQGQRGVVPSNFVEELTPEEVTDYRSGMVDRVVDINQSVDDDIDEIILESPIDVHVGTRYPDKITLMWTPPRYCDDTDGYEIFLEDKAVARLSGHQHEMGVVHNLQVGETYNIKMRSYNNKGQLSDFSDTLVYTHQLEETEANGAPDVEAGPDEVDVEVDESTARHYVALYDYDPFQDSPNENPEEELALLEGQIVKIFGDVGDDGFFYGELNGKRGLLPSNYVEEVDLQDPLVREGLEGPNDGSRLESNDDDAYADETFESDSEVGLPEGAANFPVGSLVVGMYDYVPEELSPNDDAAAEELAFQEQDVLKILAEIDEDGFYLAEHRATGKEGLVPCNFIELMSDDNVVEEEVSEKKKGFFSRLRK